jgi:hypothetical protein
MRPKWMTGYSDEADESTPTPREVVIVKMKTGAFCYVRNCDKVIPHICYSFINKKSAVGFCKLHGYKIVTKKIA